MSGDSNRVLSAGLGPIDPASNLRRVLVSVGWDYYVAMVKRTPNELSTFLSRAGDDGWELVSVMPDEESGPPWLQLILKRPKPAE